MGLVLSESYKGIDAEYWKITSQTENYITGDIYVVISLYKDKATRDITVENILKKEQHKVTGMDKARLDVYSLLKDDIPTPGFDGDGNPIIIYVPSKFKNSVDLI